MVVIVVFKLNEGADETATLPRVGVGFCGVNFRPTNGDDVFVGVFVVLIIGDVVIEVVVLVDVTDGVNLKPLSIEVVVVAVGMELLDVTVVLFPLLSESDTGGTNAVVDVITGLSEVFMLKLAVVSVVIVVAVEFVDGVTFPTVTSVLAGTLLSFIVLLDFLLHILSTSSYPSLPW